jgi:hypothetical protein
MTNFIDDSKNYKFIWKFFGHEAKGTALHHRIHLVQFALLHRLESTESGVEALSGGQQAFLIVSNTDRKKVEMALKPHEILDHD